MGNHHSAANASRTRKNVHWKSAGRPSPPGKPDIIPILSDDEPNAVTLRWAPAAHDGGAPLRGYQVECNRLGSTEWVRTAPPVVLRPELVLSGLDPPHRYQFRVAAVNAVGRSEYSDLSDVLTVNSDRPSSYEPPVFLQHLEDVVTLENDKTEFRATFTGSPTPTISWFKDDYEIFSSRRTAISTTESTSVLVFHQTLPSDEGEIKCTATNRMGHAVTKARLSLEAAPKLRYPRQYEDGLLYEINETVFLKTSIVGKPTPTIEWRHDGQPITVNERVQVTNTSKFSMLKIHSARRSDRGEYQILAKNNIGEDTASFLVTITAPPDPPRNVSVTRQVDKSVTLDWETPEDDGGCRIGNYIVEYYRSGWNVWLKATTSRKTNVTLFDLIEGSEYRFRVKAESPYGMSAPSAESAPIKIPGRSVNMEFLEVESRIINDVLTREDGEELPVSPVPRRKRASASSTPALESAPVSPVPRKQPRSSPSRESENNEFMLVLYPENNKAAEKAEKRKSFQLDLEDALSPPPISLSAPELSSRQVGSFRPLRHAVSSTELLHERAMARFYKVAAMREERSKVKDSKVIINKENHIPNHTNDLNNKTKIETPKPTSVIQKKVPEIFVKTESVESKDSNSQKSSEVKTSNTDIPQKLGPRWQSMSFDEDYTASTVSTDGDYSEEEEEGSLNEDEERANYYADEEETYNPRNKVPTSISATSLEKEQEIETEPLKPLPLPDPNFVPKPILKKKGTDIIDVKLQNSMSKNTSDDRNERLGDKGKKDEKLTLFKKFTKMPVQKPFSLPKLRKKESNKSQENNNQQVDDKKVVKENIIKKEDINDEGKTVIDYYGNIVKEYGGQRKQNTPLYLNTEDLKKVAENQELESTMNIVKERNDKVVNKASPKKVVKKQKENSSKEDSKQSLNKPIKSNVKKVVNVKDNNKITTNPKPKITKKEDRPKANNTIDLKLAEKTQVVLTTTERATIVIPIDYKKLEQKAKMNVRTAIDYTVDVYNNMLQSRQGFRCIRFISQFRAQPTDCIPFIAPRKIIDPAACTSRDKGLVLGVYDNEDLHNEKPLLTRSAQKYDKLCNGKLWKQLSLTPIPKLGKYRVFYDLEESFAYVAVAGLGSQGICNELEQMNEMKEAIRTAAAVGAAALQKFKPSTIHLESFGDAEVSAEGAQLSIWKFREYRRASSSEVIPAPKLELYDDCNFDGWKKGQLKAESQNLARYLQEMPANILTPTAFAKIAVDLLCELDINVEVRTRGWAASRGMGGFVAIGQSSIQQPLYVEVSYYGASASDRPVVLIGKGVTFNSGSIDLKPPEELRFMKGDMAGAACVLATIRAAANMKLPINIRGILPLCELMPSGKSPKVGDVVPSAGGKTVLIRYPSREGRLLIADSLIYARSYWPKYIIDVGTISKELCHSFGEAACACYSNSKELAYHMFKASHKTGDRVWPLPLWRQYEDRIKDTDTADIANTAVDNFGDSPNGAAFLKQFVCDSKWLHLDTYNVAYTTGRDFAYLRRGMTGRPTRSLIELLHNILPKEQNEAKKC
ncbi:muscle M-line assembly protein unc-89-like [Aricia agestis]|uniref:muscle M-line assembly protein unc-89-like n=1 Tax=Aricia agestis TaxID=91739 RepID=UPI001C203DFD|nr:muscle M-line assembly protein unc-89-like [Aricia agestis]